MYNMYIVYIVKRKRRVIGILYKAGYIGFSYLFILGIYI